MTSTWRPRREMARENITRKWAVIQAEQQVREQNFPAWVDERSGLRVMGDNL